MRLNDIGTQQTVYVEILMSAHLFGSLISEDFLIFVIS